MSIPYVSNRSLYVRVAAWGRHVPSLVALCACTQQSFEPYICNTCNWRHAVSKAPRTRFQPFSFHRRSILYVLLSRIKHTFRSARPSFGFITRSVLNLASSEGSEGICFIHSTHGQQRSSSTFGRSGRMVTLQGTAWGLRGLAASVLIWCWAFGSGWSTSRFVFWSQNVCSTWVIKKHTRLVGSVLRAPLWYRANPEAQEMHFFPTSVDGSAGSACCCLLLCSPSFLHGTNLLLRLKSPSLRPCLLCLLSHSAGSAAQLFCSLLSVTVSWKGTFWSCWFLSTWNWAPKALHPPVLCPMEQALCWGWICFTELKEPDLLIQKYAFRCKGIQLLCWKHCSNIVTHLKTKEETRVTVCNPVCLAASWHSSV